MVESNNRATTAPDVNPRDVFWRCLSVRLSPYNLWIRREFPIGKYFVDVYVHPYWVFEIDGPEHRTRRMQESDEERTFCLQATGRKVTRFSNEEVRNELERIIALSFSLIIPPHPLPKEVIRWHNISQEAK